MQIDDHAGIIRGVSVISKGEAKGHNLEIDDKTLAQVKECADRKTKGVKVKADHGSGILATIGYLRNFALEKGKVIADLYLLQSSGVKDRLLEMAKVIPDEFGLSIAFEGQDEKAGEKTLARCSNLLSADIVDMPAANPGGLFSAKLNSKLFQFSIPGEVDNPNKTMTDAPAAAKEDMKPETKPEDKPASPSVEERMSALESKLADYEKRLGDMAEKGEEGKDPEKDEAVAEPVKTEMEEGEDKPEVKVEIESEKEDEKQDEADELAAIVDRAVVKSLAALGVRPVALSVDASKEQPKATSLSVKDEFHSKATELGSKAKAWQWFAANKPESVKELATVL